MNIRTTQAQTQPSIQSLDREYLLSVRGGADSGNLERLEKILDAIMPMGLPLTGWPAPVAGDILVGVGQLVGGLPGQIVEFAGSVLSKSLESR